MPTIGDFVPGYEAIAMDGIGAPKRHAGGNRRLNKKSMPRSPIRR